MMYRYALLYLVGPVLVNGQFNIMSHMLSGGTGSGSGNQACMGQKVSCLPWCSRTTDGRGCTTCDCNLGNVHGKNVTTTTGRDVYTQKTAPQAFSPFLALLSGGKGPVGGSLPGAGLGAMSGIYPGFGGGPQMGPVNPMASVFGSNSMYGGGVPGAFGGIPNGPQGSASHGTGSDCGTAPYTCMMPPPWCQRIPDMKGCVKCYCGQDLAKFLQTLNGVTDKPEVTSQEGHHLASSAGTTLSSILKSTSVVRRTTLKPPLGKACLVDFMCTLSCDTGYQTDERACPVCACMGDSFASSQDQTTVDQPAPVQSSTQNQDGGMIMCPGIFACDAVCVTGYRTDALGCPICQCETD